MLRRQMSFNGKSDMGILYLVPTPIGNLEDMTFRAIDTLKSVDAIAAEDTRQTKKLCHVYEIETPLVSYHEHNKESSGHKIIEWLKSGKNIALVSDAGLPTISDPGAEIVKDFTDIGGYVVPVAGSKCRINSSYCFRYCTMTFFLLRFSQQTEKRKEEGA